MTRILAIAIVAATLFALGGCKAVKSGQHTDPGLTVEEWYVMTTSFLGLPVSTHIYFCPKQMAKGPAKCTEALVHEASGEAPAADMSGGFGPPPQPGVPPAPGGYGQPAPGGYGQPAPGGYGQPAPGGYPQPAPGGYPQPAPGGYTPPPAPTPTPTPTPTPGTPSPPAPGY